MNKSNHCFCFKSTIRSKVTAGRIFFLEKSQWCSVISVSSSTFKVTVCSSKLQHTRQEKLQRGKDSLFFFFLSSRLSVSQQSAKKICYYFRVTSIFAGNHATSRLYVCSFSKCTASLARSTQRFNKKAENKIMPRIFFVKFMKSVHEPRTWKWAKGLFPAGL